MTESPAPEESADSWTIGRLLAWTKVHLADRAVDEPRLSAELLLARAMGCRRIDLYARYGEAPASQQRAAFRDLVRAAAEHQPIAYLIGHREFYSLDFKVTPDVLIPRPETELLVERALAWCSEQSRTANGGLRTNGHDPTPPTSNPPSPIADRLNVLDLGTGSGCIAVTIAKRRPEAHLIATDVSEAALSVAEDNARRHGVADRVRCVQADMLDLPAEVVPSGGFDLIVSNPPYVAEDEYDALPENVRRYEPHQALFGGGGGLDAFRRIASKVRDVLRPGGALILEVGHTQADTVEDIFTTTVRLRMSGRYKDVNGIVRALQFT